MNKPLLFTADWCNHCTKLKEDFASRLNEFEIIDCDKSKEVAIKHNITILPTIVKGDLKLVNPERKQVEELLNS